MCLLKIIKLADDKSVNKSEIYTPGSHASKKNRSYYQVIDFFEGLI